jgi:hypothetical protein
MSDVFTCAARRRAFARAAATLTAWVIAVLPVTATAQARYEEYSLKAAFVYRFPQFVDWPEQALHSPAIDICVASPNPFSGSLRHLVEGESLGGRPLRVRDIHRAADLAGCHALFLTPRSDDADELIRAAATRPILTIGEGDDFLDAGGIIALRIVDRKIRFDVDADHARRAGLRINAQLLNLASTVRGGSR